MRASVGLAAAAQSLSGGWMSYGCEGHYGVKLAQFEAPSLLRWIDKLTLPPSPGLAVWTITSYFGASTCQPNFLDSSVGKYYLYILV